jgi:hypothetical protein
MDAPTGIESAIPASREHLCLESSWELDGWPSQAPELSTAANRRIRGPMRLAHLADADARHASLRWQNFEERGNATDVC